MERVREERRAAVPLLIFFFKELCRVPLQTEVLEHPFPECWPASSLQMRDENGTLPGQGEAEGGPPCRMPFPHVASPDKCPKSPKAPPPFLPCLLFSLAWLTSKLLSTEALWVFPFSSHLLEDEYLL